MSRVLNRLKNEEGSGLILALMTLMVLSVLGAALGFVTIGGYRLSSVNRDTTSAYYIAEAGANQTFEEIKAIVLETYENAPNEKDFFEDLEENFDKYSKGSTIIFDKQFGETPMAEILLYDKPLSDEGYINYKIESTGTIDRKSRIVEKEFKVKWIGKNTGSSPLPYNDSVAAFINKNILIDSGQIQGDILINSINSSPFSISNSGSNQVNLENIFYNAENNKEFFTGSGNNYINQLRPKLVPHNNTIDFSQMNIQIKEMINYGKQNFTTLNTDLGTQQSNRLVLDRDYYKKDFNVLGHNQVIEIGNKEINLVVDSLKFYWGGLNVQGEGTLNIFIKDEIWFESNGWQVNMNSSNNNLNIILLNENNKAVNFMNNNRFRAFLITPQSNVNIGGSGTLEGGIIANSLTLSNMGSVKFLSHKLPEIFSAVDNQESTDSGELISSVPIVESR